MRAVAAMLNQRRPQTHNALTGNVINQTHVCYILIALAITSDYILTTFRLL